MVFDTGLAKRKIDIKNAEKIWLQALKLLNSDCPSKSCGWCDGK